MNNLYINTWKKMQEGKYYTARELNVAPAHMTALFNRKMVERTETSPRTYRKLRNPYVAIADLVFTHDCEYFSLYKKEGLGMMCRFLNDKIVDAWDNAYDVSEVVSIQIGTERYDV